MGRLATLPAISHTATSTAQIGDFHIAPSLPRQEVVGDFLWMRQHRVMASVDLCVGAVQSFGGPPLMHFWGQRTPRAAQHVDLPRVRPEVAQVNWIVGRADPLLRIAILRSAAAGRGAKTGSGAALRRCCETPGPRAD